MLLNDTEMTIARLRQIEADRDAARAEAVAIRRAAVALVEAAHRPSSLGPTTHELSVPHATLQALTDILAHPGPGTVLLNERDTATQRNTWLLAERDALAQNLKDSAAVQDELRETITALQARADAAERERDAAYSQVEGWKRLTQQKDEEIAALGKMLADATAEATDG